jgi:tripartite-type tricarboxylate transporter receptor subunit TctC
MNQAANSRRRFVRHWLLPVLTAIASAAGQAAAQPAYPDKPVRIVVPFAAGGAVDILTRVLAQPLAQGLGQQVIVDPRPGAGGNVGVEHVAKSAPDGHTLVMATTGTHTINPGLYRNLPFDAVKDFRPITVIASVPNLLVVHPSVPAKSVAELVALAKAKPGQLNFASFGNGTSNHLSGELLKSEASIDVVHIPYKNAPQAVADLVSGQVAFAFVNAPLALPQVKAGKLRALAVTGAKRSPAAPDLPTMAEAGLPGFVVESWYGLMAPAGTPDAVVQRLQRETVTALSRPEVKEAFGKQGADVETSTPAELTAMVKSGIARWSEVIRKSGARID